MYFFKKVRKQIWEWSRGAPTHIKPTLIHITKHLFPNTRTLYFCILIFPGSTSSSNSPRPGLTQSTIYSDHNHSGYHSDHQLSLHVSTSITGVNIL